MAIEPTAEITLLLQRWQAGDRGAEEKLWPILYDELEGLASSALRRGAGRQTLQTTELLNEACVRMLGRSERTWPHRGRFFAFAAKVMRRILVDHARRRQAEKRRGVVVETPPQRIADPSSNGDFGVLETPRWWWLSGKPGYDEPRGPLRPPVRRLESRR